MREIEDVVLRRAGDPAIARACFKWPAALARGPQFEQRDYAAARETIQGIDRRTAGEQALPDRPRALLIAGPVMDGEHVRWFDRRPLFGRRIVVTTEVVRGEEPVGLLEELGATISMPMDQFCWQRIPRRSIARAMEAGETD